VIAREWRLTFTPRFSLLLCIAAACSDPSAGGAVLKASDTSASGGDTDSDTDTASPNDSGNADSAGDSGADSGGGDTGEEPEPTVRFVALGDAGEGNTEQFAVADAIGAVCLRDGCDFALYLGDNFYDSGVDDTGDSQWDAKF